MNKSKLSKPILWILSIVSLAVGIFCLVHFGKQAIDIYNPNNTDITGKIVSYIRVKIYQNGLEVTGYHAVVQYTWEGQTKIFKDISIASREKPLISDDYKLVYIAKNGRVASKEHVNTLIPLLAMPALFILVPVILICSAYKVKIHLEYIAIFLLTIVPAAYLLYFFDKYKTLNLYKILLINKWILIPIAMLLVAFLIIVNTVRYANKEKPLYVELTLTSIQDGIAYFNGGIMTGYMDLYYRNLKPGEEAFLKENTKYEVNIKPAGCFQPSDNGKVTLDELTMEDFREIFH